MTTSDFESDVDFFSRYFGLERDDVSRAYEGQQEKLGQLFEKSATNWHKAALTVITGILACVAGAAAEPWTLVATAPATLYFFDKFSQPLQEVQAEIRADVAQVRNTPAAKPV